MKYQAPKGKRIKHSFHGFTTLEPGWWYDKVNKLWTNDYIFKNKEGSFSTHQPCNSLRAFRRKLKKAPKGVEFVLVSHWVGYDIYGKGQPND